MQLPLRWRADSARLEAFLVALPHPPRWVVELRGPGWLVEPIFERLAKYRVALCVHDMLKDHPRRTTAGGRAVRNAFDLRRYLGGAGQRAIA